LQGAAAALFLLLGHLCLVASPLHTEILERPTGPATLDSGGPPAHGAPCILPDHPSPEGGSTGDCRLEPTPLAPSGRTIAASSDLTIPGWASPALGALAGPGDALSGPQRPTAGPSRAFLQVFRD
jgi:hypothetical protein